MGYQQKMFNRLFKRKNETNVDDCSVDLNVRPKVGEIRTQGMTETLFLSPLPLPTGQLALGRHSYSSINDVYLELGGDNKGVLDATKLGASYFLGVLVFILFVPLLLTLIVMVFTPSHIERESAELWDMLWTLYHLTSLYCLPLILLGAWVHVGGTLSDVRKLAKQFPMRFHRQRREVCYIDHKRNNKVVIAPWEQVVAWVSTTQMVSQYGATRLHEFGMALEQGKGEDTLFLISAQPSDAHSFGMWEGIRRYMEDGLQEPQQNFFADMISADQRELELLPYEGLHTFEIEKYYVRRRCGLEGSGAHLSDEERDRRGYRPRKIWPLRWWYVRRVLTFWKLPYQVAEWAHRAGRPVLPEEMQRWSQPLAPDQWAKPSQELKHASQQVVSDMAKGASFSEACSTVKVVGKS